MGKIDRARRMSTAARGILLAAVLAGLFGMHVLTADDGSSGHGALPTAGMSGHTGMTGHDAMVQSVPAPHAPASDPIPAGGQVVGGGHDSVAVTAGSGSGGGDHQAMAGCILFLVVGGAALILLLLRFRSDGPAVGLGRSAGIAVTDQRRRGPPDRWPRVALCVIRV